MLINYKLQNFRCEEIMNEREEIPPLGTWAPRERRYIAEWAEKKFPGFTKYFNVPLGPIPESLVKEMGFERARRLYRRWRNYADCLIILPDKTIIAEAEIRDPRNAIGDLLYYKVLIPKTPDLPGGLDRKIEFWLVVPSDFKFIESLAKEQGIEVDYYDPEWLSSYIEEWKKYYSEEGQIKREIRKRLSRL